MNEEEGANFIFIHSSINEIEVSSESEFQTVNSISYFSKLGISLLWTLEQAKTGHILLHQAVRKEGKQINF